MALVGIGVFFLIENGELLTGKPEWRDPQSLPNTVFELEELAGKGDANAQYKLALMLLERLNEPLNMYGIKPAEMTCIGWLVVASDNGHKLANEELGTAWTSYELKHWELCGKAILNKYPKAAN